MEIEKFEVLENKIKGLVKNYSRVAERNKVLDDELDTKRRETGKLNEKKAAAVKMVKRLIKILDKLDLPAE